MRYVTTTSSSNSSSDSTKGDVTATPSSGPAVDGRPSTVACDRDRSQGERRSDESSTCLRLMVGITVVVAVFVLCAVIALVTFVCIKRRPNNTTNQRLYLYLVYVIDIHFVTVCHCHAE